jgi:hypothetical protein
MNKLARLNSTDRNQKPFNMHIFKVCFNSKLINCLYALCVIHTVTKL